MMLYANLVLARGVPEFVADLVEAGGAGLIVPDLPLEESGPLLEACDAAGIALVPLVAPDDARGPPGARSAPGRAASSTRSR